MQSARLIFIGLILIQIFPVYAVASGPNCADVFNSQKSQSESDIRLQAGERLLKYRDSVSKEILEREYVLDPFLLALLAKEHVLLIGPPGNAKTNLSKILLNNIVDRETGESSVYSMQMNKEITLSDTHGSLNFKALADEGAIQRNYQEGILGARYGFVDESFDIRPGAFRNLLDVLAERSHSQGTKHHKGLTEVVVAATNKTLPEVYEEFNNSEAPRALIDRFSFVFFVPKEMESLKNDRQIFKSARSYDKEVEKLTFQDLEVLREAMEEVEIPDYVADLASMIHYNLSPAMEAREVKSLEQYREKIQNGEHALPPFRASKYMSPRTLGKAGKILKAIVVLAHIKSGGKKPLVATTEDLYQLRFFYQMNGPESTFLDKQMVRALKEHEKEQIKSVQIEREVANKVFDDVLKEFNETIASFRLPELDEKVERYKGHTNFERRKIVDVIKAMYQQSLIEAAKTDRDELTPETLAYQLTQEVLADFSYKIFNEKSQIVLRQWEKEVGYTPAPRTERQKRKYEFRYGFGERTRSLKALEESQKKENLSQEIKETSVSRVDRYTKAYTHKVGLIGGKSKFWDYSPANNEISYIEEASHSIHSTTFNLSTRTEGVPYRISGNTREFQIIGDYAFAMFGRASKARLLVDKKLPNGSTVESLLRVEGVDGISQFLPDPKAQSSGDTELFYLVYSVGNDNFIGQGVVHRITRDENAGLTMQIETFGKQIGIQSGVATAALTWAGQKTRLAVLSNNWEFNLYDDAQLIASEAINPSFLASTHELVSRLEKRILVLSPDHYLIFGLGGDNNTAAMLYSADTPKNGFEIPKTDFRGVVNIAQSPDQKRVALIYRDAIDVFTLTAQDLTTHEGRLNVLKPESADTQIVGGGIVEFLSARITNEGKIVALTTEGFVVYEVEQ